MITKIISNDPYEYGNVALTGTPEQPRAINLFIKASEGDREVFREINLLPAVFWKLENPLIAFWNGCKTIHEIRTSSSESSGVIADNLGRAIMGMLFPPSNAIRRWHLENHDYSTQILDQISEKSEIAGIAIEGSVCKTLPLTKLDSLTDDLANINHQRRLYILSELVKTSLLETGKILELSQETLQPVSGVVVAAIESLDTLKANERDIKEIKARLKRLEENKESLTPSNTLELNTLNKNISKLVSERLKVFKEHRATPPDEPKS